MTRSTVVDLWLCIILSIFSYVTNCKRDNYGAIITRLLLQSAYGDNAEDRRYPPCILEHTAMRQKARMALEATFADGKKSIGHIDSWSTSNEFADRILKQK